MKTSLLIGLMVVLAFTGCATKVTRTDVNAVTDFSGSWNDTDARLTAEAMIADCLNGNWINEFNKEKGRTPIVIVGKIKNRTYEHIRSDVFTSSLERALTNSGKVNFVADKENRMDIREEREDQQAGNTEPETISEKGHETGADFMLQGAIEGIKDSVKGKYAMFYQVTLVMVDLKTNQKKWISQKEIKKIVERPQVKM
jgi:uncharacterized protein (TIGR02722 family)